MLRAFVYCEMVLTKHINFFFFQLPKAEQRPFVHLKKKIIQVRNDYSPQLSKLFHNCQLKNK